MLREPEGRYDPLSTCPKCGASGELVETRCCEGGRPRAFSEPELHALKPHLDRVCRRCGYLWLERCLDDPEGVPA